MADFAVYERCATGRNSLGLQACQSINQPMKIDTSDLTGRPNAFWFGLPIAGFLLSLQGLPSPHLLALFVGLIPFPTLLALMLMKNRKQQMAVRQASRSFLLGLLVIFIPCFAAFIIQLVRRQFGAI
jgi:hypothetical protein